jgi:hypothetical protein
MVDILPAIGVIADNVFVLGYDLATNLRGTSVLTSGTAVSFGLPDVTSGSYVTVFSASIGIEDVGFMEVLSLFVDLFWELKGDGRTRWQVSGDGGLSFVTIHEQNFIGLLVLTPVERGGTGTWLTNSVQSGIDILPGDDKFQIRLQLRATAGFTVSSKLDDRSFLSLQYRRKITTET